MKSIKSVILLLCCLFSYSAFAGGTVPEALEGTIPINHSHRHLGDQQAQHVWTLAQCIDYATANNIQIKRLELSQKNVEIQLKEAKNEYLPTAGASIGYNFDFGRAPQSDGVLVNRNASSASLHANVSLPLFSGLSTVNRINASKEELTAAFENLNKAKEDLALNVCALFINILFQQELLASCQIQRALGQEQTVRTARLVESGKVARNKLLEMESNLAKEEMTVTEAENATLLARLDLIQALELDLSPKDFQITTPDIKQIGLGEHSVISAEQTYEGAVENRPAVKAQERTIEASRYALKVARSGYYPTLALGASYGNGYYTYFGKSFDGINMPFASQMELNSRYTVGLSLSIPLFERFNTANATKRAKISIHNNELILEEVKKRLYKEIQQAYYNVEAAEKKYMSASKALESTKTAFEFATMSYESEKVTTYELNQAKTNYAVSQLQQIQAQYDYLLKRKILDFYQGIPIDF